MKEGVVKFDCEWIRTGALACPPQLLQVRNMLYADGLIGTTQEGLGFGNVSMRAAGGCQFFITGSQTGGLAALTAQHVAKVVCFDHSRNWLRCEGPVSASSESLTHAAVYQNAPAVNGVIHIHNRLMWRKMLGVYAGTSVLAEYGSTALAGEVGLLVQSPAVVQGHALVLAGHADGILFFAHDLEEAGRICLEML